MEEVLFDPERKWRPRGLCIGADPELFFADAGQPQRIASQKIQAQWARAKAICAHCPVLAECQRDTLGEEYGVWGGKDENERWRERRRLPRQAAKWPTDKRLAWARVLKELRDEGKTLRDISLATGFSAPLTEKLLEELEEQPEPKAEVVELPAPASPGGEYHRPDFPEVRGSRDAWVRHDTRVSDAWYVSQTADGRWFRFKCFSGRGNVRKWFAAEDVVIYRPQVPVIAEYAARPDEPGKPLTIKPTPTRAYVSTYCPNRHAMTEANTHRDGRGWRSCRACRRVRTRRRKENERAASRPHLALIA
jgi:WhiB family redox-sensing transcriptional regulator